MERVTIDKIESHLRKAETKHPDFGIVFPRQTVQAAEASLRVCREKLAQCVRLGAARVEDVLLCELAEAWDAYARRDYAQAEDEVYDAIAALLRLAEAIKNKKENEND